MLHCAQQPWCVVPFLWEKCSFCLTQAGIPAWKNGFLLSVCYLSCVRLSGCSIKEPVFPLSVSSDKWEVYLMLAQDEANMFLLLFYTFFFAGICRL